MGNYMSAEPPKTPWKILHQEIIQLGEEFEVEWGDEGATGKEPVKYLCCPKNPNHSTMVRLSQFTLGDIPAPWRHPITYNTIMRESHRVVKISCTYVSPDRPDKYCHSQHRGKLMDYCGTGVLCNLQEVLPQLPIECPLKNCKTPRPHNVTPIFKVATANHVVFDNSEADKATLTFFYDSDTTDTVRGEVLDVLNSNKECDSILIRCVSHDLDLFNKIQEFPHFAPPFPPFPSPQEREPLLFILSHPHGYYKHVSFGKWVGYRRRFIVDGIKKAGFFDWMCNDYWKLSVSLRRWESKCPTIRETGGYVTEDVFVSSELFCEMEQEVRKNPNITAKEFDGISDWRDEMALMTYTAATCPGSSGAPVNVFFDKDDGDVMFWRFATHFRQYKDILNASGHVHLPRKVYEQIKPYKLSLISEN